MKWLCSICTLLIIACFTVGLFALLIFLDFETKASLSLGTFLSKSAQGIPVNNLSPSIFERTLQENK